MTVVVVLVAVSAALVLGAAWGALRPAGPRAEGAVLALAAGAVIASLATEVFPKAFADSHHEAGAAVAAGFVLALALRG